MNMKSFVFTFLLLWHCLFNSILVFGQMINLFKILCTFQFFVYYFDSCSCLNEVFSIQYDFVIWNYIKKKIKETTKMKKNILLHHWMMWWQYGYIRRVNKLFTVCIAYCRVLSLLFLHCCCLHSFLIRISNHYCKRYC